MEQGNEAINVAFPSIKMEGGSVIFNPETIENFSGAELLMFYCNAAKTCCDAIGHGKANRNRNRAEQIAAELEKRGHPCPDFYDAARMGKFNGIGHV